ncbi:MAG: DUF4115 domain-containing protein [Candidatus Moranbacteria bacterium]|nr:DUF4115 domain-containing protein [Candidatus Moranbacteria bacterium]
MSLTLGERLGQIRAERRMSLHEVSRGTRIQIKYLQYLENGEYDKLPARVYVKGFLRSYANFMGISENPLIRSYERERGIQNNIKRERESGGIEKDRKPFSISTFAITPKIITLVAVIVLIAGAFFYLYKELDNFISTPRLVVSSPLENETIEGGQIYIVGKSEKDGRVFINEQPIVVNDEGEFRESISLQNGLNIVTIRAVNRFNKETIKTLSIYSNYENADLFSQDESNGNFGQSMEEGVKVPEKIDLEVGSKDESVWVSIEADGKLVFSGVLQPGAWHKITANTEAIVSSGKGNETLIRINGQDNGTLSQEASPIKDVVFNLDSIINNNQEKELNLEQ